MIVSGICWPLCDWTLRVQLQGSRWRTAPFCILLDASSFHGVGFVVSARLPAASCILWVIEKRCSCVFLLWFRCAQSSTQSSLQQLFGSFVSMTPQGVADLYLSSQGRHVMLCSHCVLFALQCASVHSPFCWFFLKISCLSFFFWVKIIDVSVWDLVPYGMIWHDAARCRTTEQRTFVWLKGLCMWHTSTCEKFCMTPKTDVAEWRLDCLSRVRPTSSCTSATLVFSINFMVY